MVILAGNPVYSAQKTDISKITYKNKTYPLYPKTLQEPPGIPSPFTTNTGMEMVIGCRKDGKYHLFPITVENNGTLNYKKQQYGKGRQLEKDSLDFPALAKTGLHDEAELNRTRTITGKPVSEITNIGRPMQYSRAGFMSENENILSILTEDNRTVKQLKSTHPEMARPLFHVWNIILQGIKQDIWFYEEMELPTVSLILKELLKRNENGLAASLKPEERLVVACVHHSMLLASILRHQGIPVRIRAGHAKYIGGRKGIRVTHAICEVWDKEKSRWILGDPDRNRINFPRHEFEFAHEIWTRLRYTTTAGQTDFTI